MSAPFLASFDDQSDSWEVGGAATSIEEAMAEAITDAWANEEDPPCGRLLRVWPADRYCDAIERVIPE